MSDYIFFPITFIVGALCVYIAMQPFAERLPTGPVSGGSDGAMNIVVDGSDLYRFRTGGPGGIDVLQDEAGEPILRVMRRAGETYDDPRMGAHLILAQDVEFAFQSNAVQVEIVARSGQEYGARAFEANYFAKPGAESGWRSYELTNEFKTYVLNWRPPRYSGVNGYDYLGVRPEILGKRRAVEIRSIRLSASGS